MAELTKNNSSKISTMLSKIANGQSPPVTNGSNGESVQATQAALATLGYDTNGISKSGSKSSQSKSTDSQVLTYLKYAAAVTPVGLLASGLEVETPHVERNEGFKTESLLANANRVSGESDSGDNISPGSRPGGNSPHAGTVNRIMDSLVTGAVSTGMVAAIKQFQQDNGLAADGVVGVQTAKKLIEKLNDKTTISAESNSNTVTTLFGEKPTVAKDELRVGIQSVPTTVSVVSSNQTTSTSDKKTENSSSVTTTTTKTTTTNIKQVDTSTSNIWYPPIEGDVTWDTERSGSPGKVTFKVRADIPISEGDAVSLQYGDKNVFLGFIFERSMSKDGLISVTAYDQTKYFNNPDTYVFNKVKASDVVKKIAKDYGFETGTIEDTAVVIPSIVEDNQTLFDIVYNALDKTVAAGDQVFVFYDDYGKLTLKSLESMRVNLLLCEDTVGDYDYKSSIEDNVYNQIVLYHDDSETNKRQYFTASDQSNIAKWGLLRKTEKVETTNGAQNLANIYLSLYNKKVRKLSIKDAFARPDVRAGTLVPVIMKVGDVSLKNFMLVEKATHTWSNGKYLMSLDLAGAGDFSV